MGWLEVAGKFPKIMNFSMVQGGRCHCFACPIPARPAAVRVKFHRQDRLDVAHLLGRCVSPVAGRWCLVWSNLSRLVNKQKPNLVPGLESFFLGFLELKKCLGG